MTENHFFSLSCLMYPHVRATPIYDQNAGYDRAWPQNIYLSPNSPLILTLRFPPGFSIERTSLVTFRRVDLLLSEPELISLHASHYSDLYDADPAFRLFADDVPVWTLSPSYYMPIFTSPLPDANYAAMVVSTAGHWTTMKFLGYRDENRPGSGIAGVLDFFAVSMQWWASEVQRMLDLHRAAHPKTEDSRLVADRKVIVRAYQSGHTDCHNHRKPLDRYVPTEHNQWNWASTWEFNRVFKVSRLHVQHHRLGMVRADAIYLYIYSYIFASTRDMHRGLLNWTWLNVMRILIQCQSDRKSRPSPRTPTSIFCPSTVPAPCAPTHIRRVTVYM